MTANSVNSTFKLQLTAEGATQHEAVDQAMELLFEMLAEKHDLGYWRETGTGNAAGNWITDGKEVDFV